MLAVRETLFSRLGMSKQCFKTIVHKLDSCKLFLVKKCTALLTSTVPHEKYAKGMFFLINLFSILYLVKKNYSTYKVCKLHRRLEDRFFLTKE